MKKILMFKGKSGGGGGNGGSPLPDNLLAWFKADGNVDDEVGNIVATPTDITYIPSIDGQAFVFNGTTSRVNTNDNILAGRSEFSISFRIYNSTDQSNRGVYGNWAGNKHIMIRKSGYAYQMYLNTSAGQKGGELLSLPADNQPYKLVFTYDGVSMKAYLNGVLSATEIACTGALRLATVGHECIGSCGAVYYGNQPIDNCRLWSTALTQEEIDNL